MAQTFKQQVQQLLFNNSSASGACRENLAGKIDDLKDKDELHTIDQRDAAEDAISEVYNLVIGRAPEWSNLFGYSDAVAQIKFTLDRERQHTEMVTKCGDAIGGFNHTT